AIQGQFRNSISTLEKVFPIYAKNSMHKKTIEALLTYVYSAYYLREYDSLISKTQKLLIQEKEFLSSNTNYLTSLHYYLGLAFWEKLDFKKSHLYFNLSLKYTLDKLHPQNAYIYTYLGRIAQRQGDFKQAIHYQNISLSINKKNGLASDIITSLTDLARAYELNHDLLSAKKTLKEAYKYISKITDLQVQQRRIWELQLHQAVLYSASNKYNSAIQIGLNLISNSHYEYEPSKYLQASNMFNIAIDYIELNNLQRADSFLTHSLFLYKQSNQTTHRDFGKLYNAEAKVLLRRKSFLKALKSSQKSILHFLTTYNDTNYFSNPTLNYTESEDALLIAIHRKAEAALGLSLKEKRIDLYQLTSNTYELALKLIDKMGQIHEAQGAKISLTKRTWHIFEDAIYAMFQLYKVTQNQKYLEKAFFFIEKSKSVQLKETLATNYAKQIGNIPDSLLELEHQLKVDLVYLENQYIQQEGNDSLQFYTNSQFLNKQDELNKLKKHFEQSFPRYYQAKYQDQHLTLKTIQQEHLQKGEGLIEYFVGDSSIYSFLITSQKIDYQIISNHQLPEQIKLFRNSILQVEQTHENLFKQFESISSRLYQELLSKYLSKNQTIHKLYIIPDGLLNYCPFELFLTASQTYNIPDFRSLPYLLRKYEIGYGFSAALLLQPLRTIQTASEGLIAFAPSYSSNSSDSIRNQRLGKFRAEVGKLRWNTQEVTQITQYLRGRPFIGSAASEETFKQNVENASIIHLAMHALVDDENPLQSRLVFTHNQDTLEDDFLHLYELYNLELNAKLVVLSACNTGFGNLERGEGVMSLGRGFAYAGCPSLTLSQWKVDDESTSQIMNLFYQELANGASKSQALRKAKLKYLDNTGPRRAVPLYWGSFVLIGDDSPVAHQTPTWIYFSILIITILSILIWWRFRKKTKLDN
ncbi:MAG: CHAT domain-containing protein, partial [Flammeovirgaceae bacterium]